MIQPLHQKRNCFFYLWVSIIVLVTGYSIFEFKDLLYGPKLVVNLPSVGNVHDAYLTVSGQAKRIARLYINDRQMFTSPDGHFQEPLLLSYGYNLIKVRAEDQFNRSVEKTVELVLN